MVKTWPFKGLSDLLGNQKVTLNHLVYKLYTALYTLYLYTQLRNHGLSTCTKWNSKSEVLETKGSLQQDIEDMTGLEEAEKKKRPCRSLTYPWRIYWWCGPEAGAKRPIGCNQWSFLIGIFWAYPCPTSESGVGRYTQFASDYFAWNVQKPRRY